MGFPLVYIGFPLVYIGFPLVYIGYRAERTLTLRFLWKKALVSLPVSPNEDTDDQSQLT